MSRSNRASQALLPALAFLALALPGPARLARAGEAPERPTCGSALRSLLRGNLRAFAELRERRAAYRAAVREGLRLEETRRRVKDEVQFAARIYQAQEPGARALALAAGFKQRIDGARTTGEIIEIQEEFKAEGIRRLREARLARAAESSAAGATAAQAPAGAAARSEAEGEAPESVLEAVEGLRSAIHSAIEVARAPLGADLEDPEPMDPLEPGERAAIAAIEPDPETLAELQSRATEVRAETRQLLAGAGGERQPTLARLGERIAAGLALLRQVMARGPAAPAAGALPAAPAPSPRSYP